MTKQDDPFEPFRRLFQQFGDAGSAFDSGPGVGWPLSPVPVPGTTTPAALGSPEATTKHAVRQLYGSMDALSGSSGGADVWNQYLDAFDVSVATTPEQFADTVVSTYSIWFQSLAQLLVENYSIRILHDELVAEEFRKTTSTQRWLWELSQGDREELLERCVGLERDLVAEMRTARERRNELLYTFGSWDEADFEAPLEDGRRYLRILTALDDRMADGPGFSFFPGNADDEDGDGPVGESGGDADGESEAGADGETERPD